MMKPSGEDPSVGKIVDASTHLVDEARVQANELVHLPMMLLKFCANPIAFIRVTPDLKTGSWVSLAIASGVLGSIVNGLLHQSIGRLLLALLILPLGSFLSVFATTWVLKLALRGVHGLKFRYRSGASIFAFANFIWWIMVGASYRFPVLALVGFALALSVAAVGFIDKLKLPRERVIQWFLALAVVHTLLWSLGNWIGS